MASSRSFISGRYISALQQYAASRGIRLSELLSPAEKDAWRRYSQKGEYPFLDFATVLERCAAAAVDDAFALGLAAKLHSRPSGVFQTIRASSATLRDAFCSLSRLCRITTSALSLTYIEDGVSGGVEFQFGPGFQTKKQFIAGELAVLALRVREHAPHNLTPSVVEFDFETPRATTAFTSLFGPNIVFAANRNRICYPLALLHKPIARLSFDTGLSLADTGISGKVADFIRGALQRGEATEGDACRALHIGRRTLQRELFLAGTTFRKILEDERRRSAEYYLVSTDLSLTSISALLGYSEQSAFSRACRTWFGIPPSSFRREMHAVAPEDEAPRLA